MKNENKHDLQLPTPRRCVCVCALERTCAWNACRGVCDLSAHVCAQKDHVAGVFGCYLSHLRVLDESARNANFVAEQTKATYMAVFEDDAWCTVAPDTGESGESACGSVLSDFAFAIE